jgi:hypothetical protein
MPPKERRRRDDKRRPVDAGQQPACGRQEHPVGRAKRRPPDLATQYRQLVTEDDDLEVLRRGRPEPQKQELQGRLECDVKNGQKHGTSDDEEAGYFMWIEFMHPTWVDVKRNGEWMVVAIRATRIQ